VIPGISVSVKPGQPHSNETRAGPGLADWRLQPLLKRLPPRPGGAGVVNRPPTDWSLVVKSRGGAMTYGVAAG